MSLTKEEKLKQNCIHCGVPLTLKNQYRYSRERGERICIPCLYKRSERSRHSRRKRDPFTIRATVMRGAYRCETKGTELRSLFDRQGGSCAICSQKLEYSDMNVDHIVSLKRGGSSEVDNLQWLCRKCNVGKWTWDQEEYITHCRLVAENN
jgi:5-methylcytosine-specific restriction endonuclease McrA